MNVVNVDLKDELKRFFGFKQFKGEQEKIIQDSWDYISMSPLEAPKGWENGPEQNRK